MKYHYSLVILSVFGASYNTLATENPFDSALSQEIQLANEEIVREGKEALKNLTGSLINRTKNNIFVENTLTKDSLPKAKIDIAYELIDALPTLNSVEDFSSQLYKIQESLADLTTIEQNRALIKLDSTCATIDESQKNNLTLAIIALIPQKELETIQTLLSKNKSELMKDFVDRHNSTYATQIANGTMTKLEYADASEKLTPEKQEDSINESNRGPFLNRIVRLYSQYKFAMIAGGTALLTGIGALLYKAYQKYYAQKNNLESCRTQNNSCTFVPTKR